ncbi:hypothetical protein [Streptomyces sp. NPDC060194]|uniref:hypothetical protein n=1 Tax=Streptomyces sp. NPDC060194 TaxID=3347069 RepID=UPI00365097B8
MTAQNQNSSVTETIDEKTPGVDARTAREKSQQAAKAAGNAALSSFKGVEAGRKAVVGAAGSVASTASGAWTQVKERKPVAASAGAGVAAAVVAAAFAAGRASQRRSHGPLTRATGGRW